MKSALFALGLLVAAVGASAQWSDNYDSYANGSWLAGQGGWEIWYSGGGDGQVTNALFASSPNSHRNYIASDCVQRFTVDGGHWIYKVKTYFPTGQTGDAYCIMMNQYDPGDNWSVQVRFGGDDGLVESQWGGQTTSLITGAWVELVVDANLDTDEMHIYYNGVDFTGALSWAENTSGGGLPQIRCLDLYNSTNDEFYWDDNSLAKFSSGPEIVDVSAASVLKGNYNSGNNASFVADDDNFYVTGGAYDPTDPLAVINATVRADGNASASSYASGKVKLIEKCTTSQAKYRVRAVKPGGGFATLMDNIVTSFSEVTFDLPLPGAVGDFIDVANGNRVRVDTRAAASNKLAGFFIYRIELLHWELTP